MKKVCIFTTSLNQGGIERSILRFLDYAISRADYTLVVRNAKTGELYKEYNRCNINILFQSVGFLNPFKCWKIYSFLKKNSFDVVCDYTGNFAGLTMWLAKKAGVLDRVTFYRLSSNLYKESILKNIYNSFVNQLVYNCATVILANSYSAFDFFFPYKNESDNRFQVIYNGICIKEFENRYDKNEVRKEFGISEDAIVIGHTGRVTWAKNFPVIVAVAERLYDSFDNVYFVCCGQGTDTELINEIDPNKRDRIKLLGYRNDIPRILSMFDIFFFPSLTEGQPNSLLEALMAGLPIVASDINAIKECLPDDLHSQLVGVEDVDTAYSKIKELIEGDKQKPSLNYSEWAMKTYKAENKFEELCLVLKI